MDELVREDKGGERENWKPFVILMNARAVEIEVTATVQELSTHLNAGCSQGVSNQLEQEHRIQPATVSEMA